MDLIIVVGEGFVRLVVPKNIVTFIYTIPTLVGKTLWPLSLNPVIVQMWFTKLIFMLSRQHSNQRSIGIKIFAK